MIGFENLRLDLRSFIPPLFAAVLAASAPQSARAQCQRPAINPSDTNSSVDFQNVDRLELRLDEPIIDPETGSPIQDLTFPVASVRYHIDMGYDANRRLVSRLDVVQPPAADGPVLGTFDDIRLADTVAADVQLHAPSGQCLRYDQAPDGQDPNSPLHQLQDGPGLSGLVVQNAADLAQQGSVRSLSGNRREVVTQLDDRAGSEVVRSYRFDGRNWLLEQVVFRQETASAVGVARYESTLTFSNHRYFINSANDEARRAAAAAAAPTAQLRPIDEGELQIPSGFDYLLRTAQATGSAKGRATGERSAPAISSTPGQNTIFQHGIYSDAGTWRKMDPWLSSEFQFGTKLLPSLPSTARLEEQTTRLIDHARATQQNDYMLVGHSQGGLISRRFAQRAPELARGVITIGTPNSGALIIKNGYAEINKQLKKLGDKISAGCRTPFDDPGCFIGALLKAGGGELLARWGFNAAIPVTTDLEPNSGFLRTLNGTGESFTRVGIENRANKRWVFMRLIGDSICEPQATCGGRNWARFTNYSYIGFRACAVIAVFRNKLNVASFCTNVANDMDKIDGFYNKLYSSDQGGDGVVHRDGQIYPNARRVIISDADSHVGETKSDKVRAALRGVLAADFNVPPRRQTPPPTPGALAVVNAASYVVGAPPEALASAFGTDLATRTEIARTFCDLVLADRSVVIKDGNGEERLACLLFVSPNQINFQVPPGTPGSEAALARIAVRDTATNHDLSVVAPIALPAVAPGLFTADASGRGLASGQLLRLRNGAWEQFAITDGCDFRAGDRLFAILYGTGVRFATAGGATIGGRTAPIVYAGPQGDFTGLDQVNLELDPALQGRTGNHDVVVSLNAKAANVVQVRIR